MIRNALVLGLLLVVACSFAGGQQAKDEPQPVDNEFLTKVFTAGHKEVQLSKLADRQSRNDKVKEFAQMMIDDHTKANQKVADLLKARKLAVIAGTEKDFKDASAKLSKLEGEAFDREYMQVMVQDHKEAVALFENQTKSGKDADVISFAKDNLPTIRHHLEHAQKLASSVGVK